MSDARYKWMPLALACGVLGAIAAIWVYWLILPGLVLGVVAIVLGWRGRSRATVSVQV